MLASSTWRLLAGGARQTEMGAFTRAAAPALARGLATKKKKKKIELDLGWGKLEEQWTAVDVKMPTLTSLEAFGDRSEHGHGGLRKFIQSMRAPLKWQNPEAHFAHTQNHRGSRDGKKGLSLNLHDFGKKSIIRLTFEGGDKHELDVTGMMQHDVLRLVLTTAGVDEARVDDAVRVRLAQIAASPQEARHNQVLLNSLPPEPEDEYDEGMPELEAGDAKLPEGSR